MDLSKKKINDTGFFKERIFYLVDNLYDGNGAKFLRAANLSHNYLQSLKSKKDPEPSAKAISQMIDAALAVAPAFNPLWLIRDTEPFFKEKEYSFVAEDGNSYSPGIFLETMAAIERIERSPNALKELPLPEGFEVQLAEFLAKLLRHRASN